MPAPYWYWLAFALFLVFAVVAPYLSPPGVATRWYALFILLLAACLLLLGWGVYGPALK